MRRLRQVRRVTRNGAESHLVRKRRRDRDCASYTCAMTSPFPNRTPSPLARLLSPLHIAAYATVALIAFDQLSRLLQQGEVSPWPVAASLVAFVALFVASEFASLRVQRVLMVLQMCAALANTVLVPSTSGPILGVIVAAQMPFAFGVGASVVFIAAALLGYGWVFHWHWHSDRPVFSVALYAGFQVFAWITANLAVRAEAARDQLAAVNAHLLATRSLLEAGARDGERLRLSRELHDVAGHSLTALKFNLELALRLPEAERAAKIEAARALADALLDDIRGVVGQLRQHDGIALEPALRLLVERVPGVAVDLRIDPTLRLDQIEQAETLVRCVQEAITNALRHADARGIAITVQHDADGVHAAIVDDGRGRSRIVPGNGLTGMRERLEGLGGRLDLESMSGRGFAVRAWLPLATSA